jgi:hypothetical protein
MIAGQSFLLALLANQDLATDVRRLVFIAGVLAVFAAVVALLRLRSREVLYSEAIAAYSERLGIPDPRPTNSNGIRLKRRGPFAWVDDDCELSLAGGSGHPATGSGSPP